MDVILNRQQPKWQRVQKLKVTAQKTRQKGKRRVGEKKDKYTK